MTRPPVCFARNAIACQPGPTATQGLTPSRCGNALQLSCSPDLGFHQQTQPDISNLIKPSLLMWVDMEMTWLAPHDGRFGCPAVFSDAAIQFCLSIKVLFKLALRQTAGTVASLLRMAGLDWPVPDFSTLSRRQKTLAVQVPYRRAGGPLNLLVPSRRRSRLPGSGQHRYQVPGRRRMAGSQARTTGATSMAQGPLSHGSWHVRHPRRGIHAQPRRRQSDTAGIARPDPGRRADRHGDGGWRMADGAYDTRHCHKAIIERDAVPIIPIRKNGRL